MFEIKQNEREIMETKHNFSVYLPILKNSPLFQGLSDGEILSVLPCVADKLLSVPDGQYVFRAGESISSMGLVLSGSLLIIQEDVWGHRHMIHKITAGDIFGEPYAAVPDTPLGSSVVAEKDCEILLLHVQKLLSVCSSACSHHTRLIQNLVTILAGKILVFNNKLTHLSKRSTKEKLLSYLSEESIRQGSLSFSIPFDRQQLADYLCVERAALSVVISKLQKEGVLSAEKNHFTLIFN